MVVRLIMLLLFCLPALAFSQQQSKGYMVTDPNGKGVYLIPEIIAEKTVSAAMSLPGVALPPAAKGMYAVQVGAFALPANAARIERQLTRDGYRVRTSGAVFHRRNLSVTVVSVGSFATRAEAEDAARKINLAYHVESLLVPADAASLALQ